MTSIEWARNADGSQGKTWNPIRAYRTADGVRLRGWHCEHVHEGCKFCYAERQNLAGARGGTRLAYKPGHRAEVEIELHHDTLVQPLSWRKPTTIFPCSMTDLFGAWVTDAMLDRVFAVMALSRQHTFIVLTKRPQRMREYLTLVRARMGAEPLGAYELIYNAMGALGAEGVTEPHPYRSAFPHGMPWPLPNIWLLTSCSEQKDAAAFIPDLLATPAAVRGVSLEPLLGDMDLTSIVYDRRYGTGLLNALTGERRGHVPNSPLGSIARLDWVIAGGESGHNARPTHPQWARSLRDQCAAAGVPFFFKQWGQWKPSTPEAAAGNPRSGWTPIVSNIGRRVDVSELYPQNGAAFVEAVGKGNAGRELDGVLHDAMPERRP